MSFLDEINLAKQHAKNNNTLIMNLKNEILNAASRGLTTIFLPLENDEDKTTRTITEYLKKENINFEFKYDRHQEQRESYMDAHMGGYHEAVARNGGSNIFTYNVTVSKFKGITIYI